MACPYFAPVRAFEAGRFTTALPLPLGDAYQGRCMSDPAEPLQPSDRDLVDCCNMGYARGKCDRLRPEGPDAVRFAVAADLGTRIRVHWVIEKDHLPDDYGILEYTADSDEVRPSPRDLHLSEQVRAYIGSYVRRRNR